MKIDIITIFPEIAEGPLGESIMKRARESGLGSRFVVTISGSSPPTSIARSMTNRMAEVPGW